MGSNPIRGATCTAPIAQRVERLVEAQEAAGSKPARCTTFNWPVAQLAEHSAVTGDRAGSTPAWPATFDSERWPSGSRRRFAKPQGRSTSRVGSNPTLSTRCARLAQLAERRSYKAEVLGSNPSACTTHATLAQLEQSAGLRCRRSKVQLLHVAPHMRR